MAWIKRNLLFVVVSVVALGALGFAGYYNYTRYQANAQEVAKLNEKYTELKRLYDQKPNPGNAKVDNIALAHDQEQQIRDLLAKTAGSFTPILPIPASTNVGSEDFAAALRQTVDEMQRDAASASVILPAKYNFSFEAQRSLMIFDPTSLNALAVQLGEVKAICDIINAAKVNSLNAIRREPVSADDAKGSQTDYISQSSVSNELAVISPYEVTFQCFTPELAAVLSGFASSPQGIIVKSFDAGPVSQTPEAGAAGGGFGQAGFPSATPVVQRTAAGGLQTVIDEKQLRVTMQLEVVKLVAKK
jgi:hypothetical protein